MSADFTFKQFSVNHDKCAMKVGTDGVLLGAWSRAASGISALDAGAGSGLIALMLAQKGCSPVHAVEIDTNAYAQCIDNFLISPWRNSLTAYNRDYRTFDAPGNIKYGLIASNPPFFNNSHKGISPARNSARHTDDLPWKDLIAKSAEILADDGIFCVIIPFTDRKTFISAAFDCGLICSRQTTVIPREGKNPERILLEFATNNCSCIESTLTILDLYGTYTEEYIGLTKDFYLNF